jgi:multisubunit Na+/H+ antiporter MnhB subunit
MPPHDYSKDIERLDEKIKTQRFAYIDAVKRKFMRAKISAIALLLAGVAVMALTLFFSSHFTLFDDLFYFFLRNTFSMEDLPPGVGSVGLIIPAVIVFVFLVWLHNRETKFWFYFVQKTQKKRSGFFVMLVEPFMMLVLGVACSAVLLSAFSYIGCDYSFCTFFKRAFIFSSNMLFNFLALSIYLIILGTVQFKRYLQLWKLGIGSLGEELKES